MAGPMHNWGVRNNGDQLIDFFIFSFSSTTMRRLIKPPQTAAAREGPSQSDTFSSSNKIHDLSFSFDRSLNNHDGLVESLKNSIVVGVFVLSRIKYPENLPRNAEGRLFRRIRNRTWSLHT